MRQKIPLFDRRRGASTTPTTPSSFRMPWRSRKKEEPRQPSASQSEFNSIRLNTADYRSLDLLRQYDDDRINASSISQPASERDNRRHSSNTNESERYHSEDPSAHQEKISRRRPGECLFLTSGYRVNAKGCSNVKDLLTAKDVSDGCEDGSFPFPERSREGILWRKRQCLMILLIALAFGAAVALSCFLGRHRSFNKSSIHTFAAANPVSRLLGLLGGSDASSDARSMWINHVVKNDDNQILVAETFESRLNAEITPLLEKYVDKIWDSGSLPPFVCHGDDRLMVAFSTTKAGLMPASITYETPCMSGPSSRSCVVKKQIPDVRDLVVRLPSKSSRYMHAVSLEIDHTSEDDPKNSSEVRHHIQDLGKISGQFRLELSDASRLALQRYCGQNKKAYSDDLMTEPVNERNTRLINIFELKRLYALLSNQSETPVGRSRAWDNRMLSTVVIDPLEHSRHSLAPIHVQQLLSHLHRHEDLKALHTPNDSPAPRITVSSPKEREQTKLLVTTTSPQLSEGENHGKNDVVSNRPSSDSEKEPASPSAPHDGHKLTSFNFQPPPSPMPKKEKEPARTSRSDTHDATSNNNSEVSSLGLSSSPADGQESDNVKKDTADDTIITEEEDKEKDIDQQNVSARSIISHRSAIVEPGSHEQQHDGPGQAFNTTGNQKGVQNLPEGVQNQSDGAQSSKVPTRPMTSISTSYPPSVSREGTNPNEISPAQVPSSTLTGSAVTSQFMPSTESHPILSSGQKYLGDSPSAERKFNMPTSLQSNSMTTKSMESGSRSVLPSSAGAPVGLGKAPSARRITQRLKRLTSGQDSKMRSSSVSYQTQTLSTSPTEQLPSRHKRVSQIRRSSNVQNMFIGSGKKQQSLSEPSSSASSASPGISRPSSPMQNGLLSAGAALVPSKSRRQGSGSSFDGTRNQVTPRGGIPVSNGVLAQSVLASSVARAHMTHPEMDPYAGRVQRIRAGNGAAPVQPISVLSIMRKKHWEHPAG